MISSHCEDILYIYTWDKCWPIVLTGVEDSTDRWNILLSSPALTMLPSWLTHTLVQLLPWTAGHWCDVTNLSCLLSHLYTVTLPLSSLTTNPSSALLRNCCITWQHTPHNYNYTVYLNVRDTGSNSCITQWTYFILAVKWVVLHKLPQA